MTRKSQHFVCCFIIQWVSQIHILRRHIFISPSFQIDHLCLGKVYGWSLWFTRILDLVPSFPKVHG
ncbi:hypothetical protein Hanom_Chr02g00107931 [Helianthus anomalus]